jgi:hypothetical protein
MTSIRVMRIAGAAKVAQDVKASMMHGDSKGVESGKGLVPYLMAATTSIASTARERRTSMPRSWTSWPANCTTPPSVLSRKRLPPSACS